MVVVVESKNVKISKVNDYDGTLRLFVPARGSRRFMQATKSVQGGLQKRRNTVIAGFK